MEKKIFNSNEVSGKTVANCTKVIPADSDIRYLGQIVDNGKQFELPWNCIFSKGGTATGGTTLALHDKHNTIICSPRKLLLENKADQMGDKVLYFKAGTSEKRLLAYIANREAANLPVKILVTNDSFYKIKNLIDLSNYRILVDEMHIAILTDSTFKAAVTQRFLNDLQGLNVTYLSATPIAKQQLQQIPELKDLPYYEVQFLNRKKIFPRRIPCNKPEIAAVNLIKDVLAGNGEVKVNSYGEEVQNGSLMIFCNSVMMIRTILGNVIKTCNLNPEDVRILCSNNEENEYIFQKLNSAFKKNSNVFKVPLAGEPFKLILATSAADSGIDIVKDDCRMITLIDGTKNRNTIADPWLAITQQVGRIRNVDENPFADEITVYYNENHHTEKEAVYQNRRDRMETVTRELLEALETSNQTVRDLIISDIKAKSLLGVIRKDADGNRLDGFLTYDEATDTIIDNNLARVADEYSWNLVNKIFKDGVSVASAFNECGSFVVTANQEYEQYDEVLELVKGETLVEDLLRKVCSDETSTMAKNYILNHYPKVKLYYDELGVDKIKQYSYQTGKLNKLLSEKDTKFESSKQIIIELSERLKTIDKITSKELKTMMQEIYTKYNIKATAKATSLKEFGFEIKEIVIKDKNQKSTNAYKIISRPTVSRTSISCMAYKPYSTNEEREVILSDLNIKYEDTVTTDLFMFLITKYALEKQGYTGFKLNVDQFNRVDATCVSPDGQVVNMEFKVRYPHNKIDEDQTLLMEKMKGDHLQTSELNISAKKEYISDERMVQVYLSVQRWRKLNEEIKNRELQYNSYLSLYKQDKWRNMIPGNYSFIADAQGIEMKKNELRRLHTFIIDNKHLFDDYIFDELAYDENLNMIYRDIIDLDQPDETQRSLYINYYKGQLLIYDIALLDKDVATGRVLTKDNFMNRNTFFGGDGYKVSKLCYYIPFELFKKIDIA
jgi:hypothetical protein